MKALVLGGTGMLGYGISKCLVDEGYDVRVFSNTSIPLDMVNKKIEYVFGDINNKDELNASMKGVNKVFDFISTSFPKDSNLSNEITITCTLLEKIIESMNECGVKDIVFPSSGGTVYGSLETGRAKEDDKLNPSNPYGVGKVLSEEMLKYYAKQGMNVLILRVGNVYGSDLYRIQPQGVIDVFVQNILTGKEINIWGDIESNQRDYIFMDDLAKATAMLAKDFNGLNIINVGSGVGTSIKDILEVLKENFSDIKVNIENNKLQGNVNRIVLDTTLLESKGFKAKYSLKEGILETIKRKKRILKDVH